MSIFSKTTAILASFVSGLVLNTVTATSTVAAEDILFLYTPVRLSLSIDSLTEFAQSGTINPDLDFYLRLADATEEETIAFQERLNQSITVDPVRLSRLLNSRLGEDFLSRLGHIINIQGGSNGKFPLRGALINAAFDPEGLSFIGFLRELPVNIEINLRELQDMVKRINNVVEATILFSEEIIRLASQEIQMTPIVDYSQLPDLTQPGEYRVTQETWMLTDPSRDRSFRVLVYYPQGELNPDTPVVIISHGLGSPPEDFGWIATYLASYGYLVAIPQHRGSDFTQVENLLDGLTRSLPITEEFIDRPLDVSFVLDELERRNQSQFNGKLELTRVGLFGHSFGGYNILALAGATIDFNHLEQECDLTRMTGNTSLLLQCRALELDRKEYNFQDERIAAVYAANPVNSAVFGPEGLAKISVPVFIAAGNFDPATPFVFEQVSSFPWLTTENKYLLLQEGQAHIDFSKIDADFNNLIQAHINITLPPPELLHEYTRATTLAFLQRHLLGDAEYEVFLQSAYLDYLSTDQPFKAYLITRISSNELNQGIEQFKRERGIR